MFYINKKHSFFCLLLIITYSYSYSMNTMQTLTYEQFKFTRPYGVLYINCLPPEIIKNHIMPHIAHFVATKYKHRLLHYKYQKKLDLKNHESLQTVCLGRPNQKAFYHHDGTYTVLPDIKQDYAQWDDSPNNKNLHVCKITIKKHTDNYVPILYNTQQEQSELGIYCPLKEYSKNKKKSLFIEVREKILDRYKIESTITHHVLSSNAAWLIFGTSHHHNNIKLFNVKERSLERSLSFNGPISALCAAHHLALFAICSHGGDIALIRPNGITHLSKKHNNIAATMINAEFSPNDKQCICYGENILLLWQIPTNISLEQTSFPCILKKITMPSPVLKATFSPDGKLIIMALKDGRLNYCNCLTGELLKHYPAPWRLREIPLDNQGPLIVCSKLNRLIFSLDSTTHNSETIPTLIVRKASGKFNFLTTYNFYPNNPKIIGLTKDERSLVFIHNTGNASQLNLYDDQDMEYVNFIEQKANFYQLCELLQICKDHKTDQRDARNTRAITGINEIRSYIARCKKLH